MITGKRRDGRAAIWRLLQCLLSTFLLPISVAAVADAVSLKLDIRSSFELARERAPSLMLASYKVEVADAERDLAKAQILPQVNVFGEWSENQIEYRGGLLAPADREYSGERYGLQARQTIFNMADWKKVSVQSALLQQSKSNLASSEARLLRQVTGAYLSVLLSDADEEYLKSELSGLKRQLQEAEALFNAKLLPLTDLLETRARHDRVHAELIAAKGATAIARERFIQLVGERDFELLPTKSDIALRPNSADLQAAIDRAHRDSPDVRAAADALRAAEEQVELERGSRLPKVYLSFNSQYSDVGFDNLTSPPRDTETLQLSVNFPLFEGGGGGARVRRAWGRFYASQSELAMVRLEVETSVRSAWLALGTSIEQVAAARQAVTSAEVSLDAARKSVGAGTAKFTDVLLSLAILTGANRDLSAAIFNQINAWVELEVAIGMNPQNVAANLFRLIH